MIFIFLLVCVLLAAVAAFFLFLYVRVYRKLLDAEVNLFKKSKEYDRQIEQLKTGKIREEAILTNMSEAVLAVDNKLALTWMNAGAKKLFEINTCSSSLLEATRLVELEEAVKEVLAEEKNLEFRLKIYKNRMQYVFNAIAVPLIGESETDTGAIIILNDLTRLQKLEQIRKDFAANVSHELRTPIQLIKGFSETILEHNLEKDELDHSLRIIHKNAINMENLTGDLLSLVSLEEEGNPKPVMTETGVSELVSEALQSVNLQAQKKNISIKESCPKDLKALVHGPFIIAALVNLLDNAIKYSAPFSRVKITVSVEPVHTAETSQDVSQNASQDSSHNTSRPAYDELVIKVQDEGIGIPLEYQERIFERFFRVDKSRSREAGGTGLGLAIVRHIAILHKGRVELESHAGEGSCFTIRIPQCGEKSAN